MWEEMEAHKAVKAVKRCDTMVIIDFVRRTGMRRRKPEVAVRFSEWLRPLMDAIKEANPDMTGISLAKILDIKSDQVSKLRYGQREPKAAEIPIIERFVGQEWPERHLILGAAHASETLRQETMRQSSSVGPPQALRARPVEVLYAAETSVFRPPVPGRRQAMTSLAALTDAPRSVDYPEHEIFAVEARDHSMDAHRPPIPRGSYALCIDYIAGKLTLTSGLVYLIRRSVDEGHTFEYIIRKAFIYTDRIDWAPMSSDSTFNTLSVATIAAVEVLGLVYGAWAPFSLIPPGYEQ